ncbi:MAG: hypothetical protein DRJ51_06030 [Thermoprotei archaeon]|nr:MAG: hypothetical protein DRJ51_06030 [Thermoprotei archaeon]RLF01793.1 MAG: hypothetical protein DRJ59_05270 [Thermoprotei archaeon]
MWHDILVRRIEDLEVTRDFIALWWLGGAGFVLKSLNSIIYIDPYFGSPRSPDWLRLIAVPIRIEDVRKVDVVLSTHEHEDHCDLDFIKHACNDLGAIFAGPDSSISRARAYGIRSDRMRALKPHETLTLKDLKITALPAHDPGSKEALTYILEVNGFAVFHSGDTLYFEELKDIGDKWSVDIALLSLGRNPPGKRFYMSPCDVVSAARDLRCKVVIPMHWDIWKRTRENPNLVKIIAKEWGLNLEVVILDLGDRFEYYRDGTYRVHYL